MTEEARQAEGFARRRVELNHNELAAERARCTGRVEELEARLTKAASERADLLQARSPLISLPDLPA